MKDEERHGHPGWRWCTFEGAREQVLLLGLETTLREKLLWLEEAEDFSLRMQDSRIKREKKQKAPKNE